MKKILYVLITAIMVTYGCQHTPKSAPVDIAAEKAAIQKVIEAHFNYMDSYNLDKLLDLITVDIVEMPPNMPRVVGKVNYASYLKSWLDYSKTLKTKEMSFPVSEFLVNGNWAFQIGMYKTKLVPQNDTVIEDEGNFIWIFKKDSIGNWKWARVISNSTKSQQ
jgi:ketosteroid isomerase-like protein